MVSTKTSASKTKASAPSIRGPGAVGNLRRARPSRPAAGGRTRPRVHDDARQGPDRHARLQRRARDDDAVGDGGGRRPDARHGAAHPAHARGARLRGAERAAVLADAARARARLRLSLLAKLDRPGAAAPEGAFGERAGILLGGDPAGHRHRLCRAHPDAAHHERGADRRLAAAGVPHLARPRAARLRRGRRGLAAHHVAPHRSPTRRRPSPSRRRSSTASRPIASRAFPSSTRSWSGACARSPCRSSTGAARRSPG